MIVTINPKTPTKISEGTCAVFSKNISQLITFTDSKGNVLETSYANSITTISNDGPIYARSHSKEIKISATFSQTLDAIKEVYTGTQETISSISPKNPSTIYISTDLVEGVVEPIAAYLGDIQFWKSHWSIGKLFKNNIQGAWFDFSDTQTMFQDVNGTKPATKDGDPVGLVLDKSQGLSLETPLLSTNSVDFESEFWAFLGVNYLAKGNTFSVYSGTAGPRLIGLVIGKVYRVVATISHTQELEIRNGGGGNAAISARFPSSNKRMVNIVFVASNTSIYFRLSGVGNLTIHDIEIAEIKGNHATQNTASARPVYRTDMDTNWLEFDGVDDSFNVHLPSGEYTEIKFDKGEVKYKYPVNVDGTYKLSSSMQSKGDISELVLVKRQLTQTEIDNITDL